MISKIRKFIEQDVWRLRVDNYPPVRAWFARKLQVVLLAVRGYNEDKVKLHAGALTYYSMLSVVPVLAMFFGIAKGFGFKHLMEEKLKDNFQGQEEVLEYFITFANRFLEDAKGGFIAGVGMALLIWTVMMMLSNIESSLNSIWQIKKARPFVRKFSDYLSLIVVAPILLFLSTGVTVFVTQLQSATAGEGLISYVGPVLTVLVKTVPYVIIWLVLTLIYVIMPNTKVKFSSALLAGIIAGTSFQLMQWGYIHFQVGVSRYNAIYGSFAALPLFLVWLRLSWMIVLFGAEISFASQNIKNYEFESDSLNISERMRRILTLLVVNLIVKNFQKGGLPHTAAIISAKLEIPIRVVRDIIYTLSEAGIVTETVTESPKENGYQPALDINCISIQYVFDKIDTMGTDNLVVDKSAEYLACSEAIIEFNDIVSKSEANRLIAQI